MISTKKILEGCLLAIARDANEKWNLYLEGAEYTEDDDPSFSKVEYSKLDYNEHLVPLYKFSGRLNVDLRAGVTTSSLHARQKVTNDVMEDFPEWAGRQSVFQELLSNQKEEWAEYSHKKVKHKTLVIRDKQYVRVLSSTLVVGDIVCAGAGDIVAADVRVIVCSPGAKVDLSQVTHTANQYKVLQENPTDLDPLSSANVVPARSSVVEGLFYGIVIRVGPNTIVAKQNQSLASSKGPITSSHRRDWSFVRKACSMQLYPLNIERLSKLNTVDILLITLPFDVSHLSESIISELHHFVHHILICREMDVMYDPSLWSPSEGYMDVFKWEDKRIESWVQEFCSGSDTTAGAILLPRQFAIVCHALTKPFSFIGGTLFEHLQGMKFATVNISLYLCVKDLTYKWCLIVGKIYVKYNRMEFYCPLRCGHL